MTSRVGALASIAVSSLNSTAPAGVVPARYPEQISGGQRQRVALARALAIQPSLLLLDEPFGALDAKVRKSLRIWLRDLYNRMGLTSIFVTHDQNEALEMADRVEVLRAGRIEQVDAPDRLYAEPVNAFVHEFLGESVRLDCIVVDGSVRFHGFCRTILPTTCTPRRATALLRPHEIGLLPGPGPARVESVHATGPMARVRVALAGRIIEVLLPEDASLPTVGQSDQVDLSRARIYAA
jgi:sulfate transport system ATP-binding protein